MQTINTQSSEAETFRQMLRMMSHAEVEGLWAADNFCMLTDSKLAVLHEVWQQKISEDVKRLDDGRRRAVKETKDTLGYWTCMGVLVVVGLLLSAVLPLLMFLVPIAIPIAGIALIWQVIKACLQ